ncbi:hypothetical protein EDB81DRAFT_646898 [Dactylonectria macrodidyma]|uniref:Vacuolar sorting protein Vps3844 C-terminal domain-containing protein n=1 Tax=Dactylonectria macrodidyma TaxID=307937 RepID=A0A9P9F811_9HYPO|nr:hypothetical protein EDB81DRAFT_646898 [Dactylonectria macrodidyma]
MKLTIGLSAALASFAAAAQHAAEVYILPEPQSGPLSSISASFARLILLQRLAPTGTGPSLRDIPDFADPEDAVALMNALGKEPLQLFADDERVSPSQLVVMLEGMTDAQFKEIGAALETKPAFTVPNPPSADAHDKLIKNDFYNVGITNDHKCPLDQVINPFEESCWSGKSTVAKYDVSKDSKIVITLVDNISKLVKLAASGEMETTLVLLPSSQSTSPKQWSEKSQDLRRRQVEAVISSDETESAATSTSSNPPPFYTSTGAIPSCFDTLDLCSTGTGNCSGRGSCLNKYAETDGSEGTRVCYTCHCLSTVTEKGTVTHWAGAACSKQDISVQFWLFAGFTIVMVGVLTLSIGMLFSVGEEKLPGVIGAGVSRSKQPSHHLTLLRKRYDFSPLKSAGLLSSLGLFFGSDLCPFIVTLSDFGRVRVEMLSSADRPKPATAKWGAACQQCSIAKAKCIRSNTALGAKCDRCERLVKHCAEQVHRPRKKRQPKPSRTAQIEERLNGLVNLLKASGGLTNADLATDTTCIPTEVDPAVSNQQTPSKRPESSFAPSDNPWAIPEIYNSYAPPSCICRPESGDAPPPPDTDEVLLNIYRNELQALHPFVVIPNNVTAAKLKAHRPFLMSAIRMVTSFRSLRSMRAQMYYLMQHIADHMLIRSERSLDLLMGILVIAAWYQYHCFMHAQLNNLIALAATLVGELGLHRSPSCLERTNLMVVKPFYPERRTNEERRALLGVWFLSSAMSLGFSRIESMRYTKYIQECAQILEDEEEYETDVNLVHLVRIQHLTERISQLNSPDSPAEEVAGVPTAPMSAYVSAFQGELDRIRNALPEDLKKDKIINAFLNTATLRLYEPPVLDTPRIISMSESLTSPTLGAASALDIFYQSRNALNEFFDNWLSIPVSEYYRQTTPIAAQLVYGLTMLGRWAKFTVPITLNQPAMPMPTDTSADNPHTVMMKADSEYAASLHSGKPTPSGSSPSVQGKDSQEVGQIVLREGTDPRLPAAVAALRSQIQTQPGLSLDVSGILSGICSRFEEANSTFQVGPTEPGALDHTLWTMSAVKVRITRAKLERWAEIVAAGTEALKIQDDNDRDFDMQDNGQVNPYKSNGDGQEPFLNGELSADPLGPSWNASTPWTSEMLQGVDPSIWFDGYLDWGAVIMNSMGNLEQ